MTNRRAAIGAQGVTIETVCRLTTAQETADVCVLAQSNVILIHSKRPVSFLGDQDLLRDTKPQSKSVPIETKKPRSKSVPIETWVSKADEGEQGDCRYLHQNIPGDEDVSGMDLYVVAGRKDWERADYFQRGRRREDSQPLGRRLPRRAARGRAVRSRNDH